MTMGVYAWVETRYHHKWEMAFKASWIFQRTDVSDCLFLPNEEYGFKPVAINRGLPKDVSEEVKQYNHEECLFHTWLTYKEIEQIDWKKPLKKRLFKMSTFICTPKTLSVPKWLSEDYVFLHHKFPPIDKKVPVVLGKKIYSYSYYPAWFEELNQKERNDVKKGKIIKKGEYVYLYKNFGGRT